MYELFCLVAYYCKIYYFWEEVINTLLAKNVVCLVTLDSQVSRLSCPVCPVYPVCPVLSSMSSIEQYYSVCPVCPVTLVSSSWIQRFPLSCWSISIASNKDLKFPAPKPEKLFLWMTSKKTVGLSCMFLVKICKR